MHHRAKTTVTHLPAKSPRRKNGEQGEASHGLLAEEDLRILGRVDRRKSAFAEDYAAMDRLALLMHSIAASKGFHSGEPKRLKDGTVFLPPKFGDWCMNLVSEVAELWEAYRKGKLGSPCDKDCGLTCAEEELADIVIRVMDTAVALGLSLGKSVLLKAAYNKTRSYRHGNKKA